MYRVTHRAQYKKPGRPMFVRTVTTETHSITAALDMLGVLSVSGPCPFCGAPLGTSSAGHPACLDCERVFPLKEDLDWENKVFIVAFEPRLRPAQCTTTCTTTTCTAISNDGTATMPCDELESIY